MKKDSIKTTEGSGKKICVECGPLPKSHATKYIESFFERIFPTLPLKFTLRLEKFIEYFFLKVGLLHRTPYRFLPSISLRSTVFLDEGLKRGLKFFTIDGPFGPIGHFHLERERKSYSFEGLPRAEFLEDARSQKIDDKALVKKTLQSIGVPTPEGKCFKCFEMKKAIKYGERLGFPLVVKPRSGSISRHVFVNIEDKEELNRALRSAFSYEPYVIVEKFMLNIRTYRATVVDFSKIAIVERVPAYVTGDSKHTVKELINIKNTDPRRGVPKQKDTTLYRIVINEKTKELLKKQGYSLDSIPDNTVHVSLQEKVILDLGADLFEVTERAHLENIALFEKVARAFNTRLVGIDFLAEDISQPWNKQHAVIIELNSLPYIDMHHFPTEGKPVNVAGYLCDVVEKYYK